MPFVFPMKKFKLEDVIDSMEPEALEGDGINLYRTSSMRRSLIPRPVLRE